MWAYFLMERGLCKKRKEKAVLHCFLLTFSLYSAFMSISCRMAGTFHYVCFHSIIHQWLKMILKFNALYLEWAHCWGRICIYLCVLRKIWNGAFLFCLLTFIQRYILYPGKVQYENCSFPISNAIWLSDFHCFSFVRNANIYM